jgi:glycine/D-amino acid oxidase-like deaminating enzyme
MVRYARLTPDRRLALGRGGGTLAYRSRIGRSFEYSGLQKEELRRDLSWLYPGLADVRLTHAWAGPVERSPVGLPAFGRLDGDPRLTYAIGYSGTGIAPAALGGRVLASLALDRDDEWAALSDPLCRIQDSGSLPPEPLRYLGGRLVQRAVLRSDRAEDRGRAAGRVDRMLSGLAPRPVED